MQKLIDRMRARKNGHLRRIGGDTVSRSLARIRVSDRPKCGDDALALATHRR